MDGRGWTIYTEETQARVLAEMPGDLAEAVVKFLVELAPRVRDAVQRGDQPPGDPADDSGIAFNVQITGLPVVMEYLVVADISEVRITSVAWVD